MTSPLYVEAGQITISHPRRAPFSTSTIRFRRQRPASTVQSTCSASPGGSERGSCRPQRPRCMAIPRFIRSTKAIVGHG